MLSADRKDGQSFSSTKMETADGRRSEEVLRYTGGYQSGQMGQTVNLLSFDFGGSNPSPPTRTPKAADRSESGRLVLSDNELRK